MKKDAAPKRTAQLNSKINLSTKNNQAAGVELAPAEWVQDTVTMLHEIGYRVVPVYPGNAAKPFKNHQTYLDMLDYENASAVGIVLEDVILVDYDGYKEGVVSLAELEAILGIELEAPVQENREGTSLHWLFRTNDKTELRHSRDGCWPGVDVKRGNQLMHIKPHKNLRDDELPPYDELPLAPPILIEKLKAQVDWLEEPSAPPEPQDLVSNILSGIALHDSLLRLAGKYIKQGMLPGAVVNTLRELMNNSQTDKTSARWKERYDDIPRTVQCVVDNNGSEWGDPIPLNTGLPPVLPFDFDLLPPDLRIFVQDISERMQCPPDFVAIPLLTILSSLSGKKIVVLPKRCDNWRVHPILWGMIIGRPGVMKSPAIGAVLKLLTRLQTNANKEYEQAVKSHKVAQMMYELELKEAEKSVKMQLKKGDKKAAEAEFSRFIEAKDNLIPVMRRYMVTDATVEALGEISIENPCGVLAYRDELHGLLQGLDAKGQEGSRSFYLQGNDGDKPFTFDRIGRGKYLHIPAVALSVLGGIQPGKLKSYVRDAESGGKGDDGLMQRFGLMAYPDVCSKWENVDRHPNEIAEEKVYKLFEKIAAMPEELDEHGCLIAKEMRFDPAAQDSFDEWRAKLEHYLRQGDWAPALESHFAKYRKLVLSLCDICSGKWARSHYDRRSQPCNTVVQILRNPCSPGLPSERQYGTGQCTIDFTENTEWKNSG